LLLDVEKGRSVWISPLDYSALDDFALLVFLAANFPDFLCVGGSSLIFFAMHDSRGCMIQIVCSLFIPMP